MKVYDAMTSTIHHVDPGDLLGSARRLLVEGGLSILPVCHDGLLLGILTDGDIERMDPSHHANEARLVKECMSVQPVTVEPSTDLGDAFDLMVHTHLRRLCVTSEGRLVGVVTMGDLARALNRQPPEPSREPPPLVQVA